MRRRILIALGLLGFGAAVAVMAQPIVIPFVSTINPSDAIQIIPRGQPSAQNQYSSPALITNQYGYYKSIPITAFTYTFGPAVTYAQFAPAGTLAAGYVTLAANPSDGARNCVFTTAQITGTYVAANTGQSINGALSNTSITANTGFCYLYSASNATWDRD